MPNCELISHEFANVIERRHKVSAHTSWVWPEKDGIATQGMSIVLFPEFNIMFDEHFEVGGFRAFSEESRSDLDGPLARPRRCAERQWGLVRTRERLKEIVSKDASAK